MTAPPGPTSQESKHPFAYVARGFEYISVVVLFLLMGFQFTNVIARYILGRPIPGGEDIIGLFLGLTIFIAMPVVTWRRNHITVPLIEQHFRGRFRYAVRLLGLVATAAAFVAIAYGIYSRAAISIKYEYVTEDLEMPHGPILYGLSALALSATILLLHPIWVFLRDRGDPPGPPGQGGLGG